MIAGAQTRNRTVPTFIWNTAPSGCFSKPATGLGAVHWACTDAAKRNATNAKREIRALRWRVMMSNLAVILDYAQAAQRDYAERPRERRRSNRSEGASGSALPQRYGFLAQLLIDQAIDQRLDTFAGFR